MRKRIFKYLKLLTCDSARVAAEEGAGEAALPDNINKPLKELIIKGNTYQKSYAGSNLFNKESVSEVNAVRVVYTETGVRLASYLNSSFPRVVFNSFAVKGDTDYVFYADVSFNPAGDEEVKAIAVIREFDQNGVQVKETFSNTVYCDGAMVRAIKTHSAAVSVGITLFSGYGVFTPIGAYVDFDDLKFNESASPQPYEPFVGGEASPSINYPQPVLNAGDGGITLSAGGSLLIPAALTVGEKELKMRFAKIGEAADELTLKNGRVVYCKRIERIESYNGEGITSAFTSSSGELSSGAAVQYVLGKAEETDITDTSLGRSLVAFAPASGAERVNFFSSPSASYIKIKYWQKI